MDESTAEPEKSAANGGAEAEDAHKQARDRKWRSEKERLALFGVRSEKGLWLILNRAAESIRLESPEHFRKCRATVADILEEIRPSDPIETMLVSQMITTHFAALDGLATAMVRDQNYLVVDKSIVQSAKFMQLFVRQLEALSKLRGMSQEQKNAAEQANVAPGSQANVGYLNTTSPTDRPTATPLLKGEASEESLESNAG